MVLITSHVIHIPGVGVAIWSRRRWPDVVQPHHDPRLTSCSTKEGHIGRPATVLIRFRSPQAAIICLSRCNLVLPVDEQPIPSNSRLHSDSKRIDGQFILFSHDSIVTMAEESLRAEAHRRHHKLQISADCISCDEKVH